MIAEKLKAAMVECRLHADILEQDLVEHGAAEYRPEDIVAGLPRQTVRLLDQLAYRFAKLQDTLGEKVLPLLLEGAQEPLPPSATFAEKLHRLERLGYIPSAETWRLLRELRNQIAHEYPEHPAIKAAILNRLFASVGVMLDFWRHVLPFAERMTK
jgi:hypothetical protein